MSASHYHNPSPPASNRVRCPVCHEAVYSRAGIHPQCALRQSELPRSKVKPQDTPAPTDPEAVDLDSAEPDAATSTPSSA